MDIVSVYGLVRSMQKYNDKCLMCDLSTKLQYSSWQTLTLKFFIYDGLNMLYCRCGIAFQEVMSRIWCLFCSCKKWGKNLQMTIKSVIKAPFLCTKSVIKGVLCHLHLKTRCNMHKVSFLNCIFMSFLSILFCTTAQFYNPIENSFYSFHWTSNQCVVTECCRHISSTQMQCHATWCGISYHHIHKKYVLLLYKS